MSEIPLDTLMQWAKPEIGEPVTLWRRIDYAVWLPSGVVAYGGPPWVIAKVDVRYDPATFELMFRDGWRPQ